MLIIYENIALHGLVLVPDWKVVQLIKKWNFSMGSVF